MNKSNKNLDKKELYKKLGALQFQKIVLKAEKFKFQIIDKFFPNLASKYDCWCDKRANKLCSKALTENEKQAIHFQYNNKKMAFRRELIEKKNRNYHFDFSNASSFYNYLVMNKKIHEKGIIKDLICIAGSTLALSITSGIIFNIATFVLIYNIFSLGIDFECVNLQNYNMCRFNEKKAALQKIESRTRAHNVEKYAGVGQVICEELSKKVESPTIDDIVESMNSVQQLEQLRKLALEIKKRRVAMEDDQPKTMKKIYK